LVFAYGPPGMSRSRILRHDELPESCNPIWVEWTEPVLAILVKPLTTEQLKDWARSEKFEMGKLVNSLAWLETRGLVAADRTNGHVVWTVAPPKTPKPRRPMPTCCPRCKGPMVPEPERVACLKCGHSVYPPGDWDVGTY